MSDYIELDNFINETFHDSLATKIQIAVEFLPEIAMDELIGVISDPTIDPTTAKLYLTTTLTETLTVKLRAFGIISTEINLVKLLDQVTFIVDLEKKEVPEHLVEGIIEHNSLEEGYAEAVSQHHNTNDYEAILEATSSIADEFGTWVYELLVDYRPDPEEPTEKRQWIIDRVKRLGSNLIGEYLIKVDNVELGLEPVAYVLALDDTLLDSIVNGPSAVSDHLASLILLSGNDKLYNEHFVRVMIKAINERVDVGIALQDIDPVTESTLATLEELEV